jgi:hypothetical protein
MTTIGKTKKFDKMDFDKNVDQRDFDLCFTNAKISMEGKDGYYTRNDAFKAGFTAAYAMFKLGK